MAYEDTSVSVTKSQSGIRQMIMTRKGAAIAFISEPPREGFQAKVEIDGSLYQIRIFGTLRQPGDRKTEIQKRSFLEQEERRIWRVLYYHLKSVFEASDSGVMEFREMMMPYIVTTNGQTIGERIMANLGAAIEHNPAKLLG